MFINLLLLSACAIIAYVLMSLYTLIEGLFAKYELWALEQKQKKDEIYNRKCVKLYNNIFNYYMDEIYLTPEITANSLANMHIRKLQRKGEIDKMYNLLKQKQAI